MFGLLSLQFQNGVRTVLSTITAMDANHRFVRLLIPEDGANGTGPLTVATPDAFLGIESYTTALSRNERLGRAHLGAGWVVAGPADDDDEAPLSPSHGSHRYACFGQSRLALPPHTGKHTLLAADAPLRIDYCQSHDTFSFIAKRT